MRIILIVLLMGVCPAAAQQKQFYDSAGRNAGRAVTDTQGTTTFYDAAGRKAGSVSQPTQPKGKSK
jgi:general stress protein YciG